MLHAVAAASPLAAAAATSLALQLFGWCIAVALKTERFFDLTGSATFLAVACGSYALSGAATKRSLLLTAAVCVWAARLGGHLFSRVLKQRDKRFDKVRDKPLRFAVWWCIQAVWVFLTVLPLVLLNSRAAQPALWWGDAIGFALWAVGFGLESVADYQKSAWKRAQPVGSSAWIDTGLWSLSRHPNYCGEILAWLGVAAVAASGGVPLLQALISPVFVAFLLLRVSGVPPLERAAAARWGSDPAWAAYVKRTRLLLPMPQGM